MKTVGDKLPSFKIVGVDSNNEFFEITNESYVGKWKVFVFYPKDFTFVCPTEIVGYDALYEEFQSRDTELLIGSVDNEYVKVAWKQADKQLTNLKTTMFADQRRSYYYENDMFSGLAEQLDVLTKDGVALRATFIVDPNDVIQHVTVNNLNVGRNPEETLRVLDALQTGEKTACARPLGGSTLG